MTTYQKFQNPPSYTSETGPVLIDQPAYPPPQPALNGQPPFVQQPRKELRLLTSLRRLVRIELILALALIFFESIVDGVIASSFIFHPGVGVCTLGTGIWVGVLGVIAAGLGWGAFRTNHGNKCLMVAYFVMAIISVVADGIMIIFAAICLSMLPWLTRSISYYNPASGREDIRSVSADQLATGRGLMTAESFLLLAAITHFITSIVSTAFICRNWCQDSQPAVAVVYFPGTNQQGNIGNETSTDPCRIAVPSGAHVQQYVIFVPMGSAQGQPVPPQPDLRNV